MNDVLADLRSFALVLLVVVVGWLLLPVILVAAVFLVPWLVWRERQRRRRLQQVVAAAHKLALIALLVFASGCRLHDLLWAPDYVWACVRWDTYTFSANGQSDSWRVCAEEGWTRAVDTIPAQPQGLP